MNYRRGFAAILPLLLLALGLAVSVYLVGKQTFFKNRAAGLAESVPNPTAWGNAAYFPNNASSSAYLEGPLASSPSAGTAIQNPFTLETWVKVSKPTSGSYLKDYSLITQTKAPTFIDYGYAYRLGLSTQDQDGSSRPIFSALRSNATPGGNNYITVGGSSLTSFPAETWTHLAVTSYSEGDLCNLNLFINGKLVDSVQQYAPNCQIFTANQQVIWIGRPPPGAGGISGYYFPGQIDETRLSNSRRYQSGFTLPSSPFGPDANTVFLLHFDGPQECNVQTNDCYTQDASGRGNKFKIVGVQFVPSTVGGEIKPPPPPPPPPDPNAGYRFLTYTCSDGYKATVGDKTNCKSASTWKEYASSLCSQRVDCPPIGGTRDQKRPCRLVTLSDYQPSDSCDVKPPPPPPPPPPEKINPCWVNVPIPQNGSPTGNNVSLTPTFSWGYNTTWSSSVNSAMLYLWDCNPKTCSAKYSTNGSGRGLNYQSASLSDFGVTSLQPSKQYWWSIVINSYWPPNGDSKYMCMPSYSFTTTGAPPKPKGYSQASYQCFSYGGLSSEKKTFATNSCQSDIDLRAQVKKTCVADLPLFCDRLVSFFPDQCPATFTPTTSCF